ncbi:MAG: hypothetical protein FI731_09700 [SAR202 cluster bacterium]|nr:hypothetical protein [SAR202 cluster bacterium]
MRAAGVSVGTAVGVAVGAAVAVGTGVAVGSEAEEPPHPIRTRIDALTTSARSDFFMSKIIGSGCR